MAWFIKGVFVDIPNIGSRYDVDLVKRMQPCGSLKGAWLFFDHAKRIKNWTTMTSHIYDS